MTTGDLGTVATTGTQTGDPTALAVWTAALTGLVMVALSVHLLLKPGLKLFGPTQERDLSFGAHDVVAALRAGAVDLQRSVILERQFPAAMGTG